MAVKDYFALFDLPRTLLIDADSLQQKFYELSKKYHPDLYQDAMPRLQEQVLRQSMLLNQAYSTLRDRRRRLLYLLSLECPERSAETQNMRVPMELFDIVEQVHDLLFELRAAEEETRNALVEKIRPLRVEALASQVKIWDAIFAIGRQWDDNERAHELAEMDEETYQAQKKQLLQRFEAENNDLSYVERLIENIDRALEQKAVGSRHKAEGSEWR